MPILILILFLMNLKEAFLESQFRIKSLGNYDEVKISYKNKNKSEEVFLAGIIKKTLGDKFLIDYKTLDGETVE